jgi:superfamily II helicase
MNTHTQAIGTFVSPEIEEDITRFAQVNGRTIEQQVRCLILNGLEVEERVQRRLRKVGMSDPLPVKGSRVLQFPASTRTHVSQ